MRSVLDYEMDYIFRLYNEKANRIGFKQMCTLSTRELQRIFTLKYNDLFKYTKDINELMGKSREQISYAILKIRRLIALWNKEGIIKVEGGIRFSANDKYAEFPIFASQHFGIIPTRETIFKLQAKTVDTFIEQYNHRIDEAGLDHRKKIKNLRDLRLALMKYKGLDSETATMLTDIYREHSTNSDIYTFAKNTNRSF